MLLHFISFFYVGNEIDNYPESNLGKVVQLYKRKITEKVRPQDIKIHLKSDGLRK